MFDQKRYFSTDWYFSTLLPPPNITGALHLGHLWNAIIQDTLMRLHQQFLNEYEQNEVGEWVKVSKCFWARGVDHAGISFQIKAEEELRAEGKLDEEKGITDEQLQELAKRNMKRIVDQYSELGYFCPNKKDPLDSEKIEYTLGQFSKARCESTFRRLFRGGLVYRSKKLVNWDTKLKTAISDAEVEYRPTKTKLYTIKYFYSGTDYIPVATTRPETIFGDVAVFVHPEDERYQHLIGKEVRVPLTDRKVKILSDSYVDQEFGTGAMKCTPAHDFADGKLGDKRGLEKISVFNEDLLMIVDPYKGIPHMEARYKIVEDLRDAGFLDKEEDYQTNVSCSARSGGLVEPLLSMQFFLRSSQLAYEAWEYWRDHREEMKVVNPSHMGRLERILKNTEDWCISRQLKWGIKIPVYIKGDEMSLEPKEGFEECQDVFDTWFSSSIWPLTFWGRLLEPDRVGGIRVMRPEDMVRKKRDFIFPFSALVSGRDILFFWIAKMVYMCYYETWELPFKKIFLHGLVLDEKGRKMSKSLGNGVDPVSLTKKWSHDVLRLFFLSNTHDANDILFSESKLEYFSRFMNKLANASKFVFSEIKEFIKTAKEEYPSLRRERIIEWDHDSIFLQQSCAMCFDVCENLKAFKFPKATNKAMSFFKEQFCNQQLETYKVMKKSGKDNRLGLLRSWINVLRLFRNIIPDFCKQEEDKIYSELKSCKFRDYVTSSPSFNIRSSTLEWWFKYLTIFRELKKSLGFVVSDNKAIKTRVYVDNEYKYGCIEQYLPLLGHELDGPVRNISVRKVSTLPNNVIAISVFGGKLNMVLELELTEVIANKYKKQVGEKVKWLKKEIDFLSRRMKGFTEKTPKTLKSEVMEKIAKYEEDLEAYQINYGV